MCSLNLMLNLIFSVAYLLAFLTRESVIELKFGRGDSLGIVEFEAATLKRMNHIESRTFQDAELFAAHFQIIQSIISSEGLLYTSIKIAHELFQTKPVALLFLTSAVLFRVLQQRASRSALCVWLETGPTVLGCFARARVESDPASSVPSARVPRDDLLESARFTHTACPVVALLWCSVLDRARTNAQAIEFLGS